MPPISFDSVPSNLRVPFVTAEFDNTQANQGAALLSYRALLIGQKTSGGSATADTLHSVSNADDVRALAGVGSQLHRQALAWFRANKSTEVWIGVLADNGSGVAASGKFSITGPATADGTLCLYIGGNLITVAVTAGESATAIAAAAVAAINAVTELPVTAAVDGTNAYQVDITAKNKGTAGNDIDLRVNYQDGEALPAGVGVTVTAMAAGATNPSLSNLIAAMGDSWFHIWAHPYTDSTSLTAIENELNSRFGPMRMIDGVAITSAAGSQSTLATLGLTRNNQHSAIAAQPGKNPLTPPCEYAAALAGVVAFYGAQDPARPLQTLEVPGARAPAEADRFTFSERNLQLFDGIGTSKVGPGSTVQVERLVTTYRLNAAGAQDPSYLDVTTLLNLMYLRYTFRNWIMSKFPRHKLAADGTRYGAGQAVITPKIAKAEAIAWFRQMEELGLVQNGDQFKADLVVERNASDPNRLDFLLPPTLVGQFVVGAAKLQFRLM